MSVEHNVRFAPTEDITLPELVEILRRTVFQDVASERGAYSRMPDDLRRHFRVEAPQ